MTINDFPKCRFGYLTKKKTTEYKYNIGDIITTNTSQLEIIEQIKMKNSGRDVKGYTYKCLNCGNIDNMNEGNLNHGYGCNVCCVPSKKVLKGYNDIWTTHLSIAKLLKYPEEGFKLSFGSAKKAIFICPECGYEKPLNIHSVVNQGIACPRCSDGVSYSNKFVRSFFDQLNEKYIPEYSPDWAYINHDNPKLNGKKIYDIYLINKNEIWEVHGGQHYIEGFGRSFKNAKSLKEQQENDKIKKELTEQNSLKYIVVDARYSEIEYIKNSLLNLPEIQRYDLSLVDWNKCHEFACSSLVKVACDLWNNDINTLEISKLMNLSKTTILSYLRQGVKLSWCNYDGYKEQYKERKIKVIQTDSNNIFIKEWNSIIDASKKLNINATTIVACCKNNKHNKTAGGFKWIYKNNWDAVNY